MSLEVVAVLPWPIPTTTPWRPREIFLWVNMSQDGLIWVFLKKGEQVVRRSVIIMADNQVDWCLAFTLIAVMVDNDECCGPK